MERVFKLMILSDKPDTNGLIYDKNVLEEAIKKWKDCGTISDLYIDGNDLIGTMDHKREYNG